MICSKLFFNHAFISKCLDLTNIMDILFSDCVSMTSSVCVSVVTRRYLYLSRPSRTDEPF